LFPLHDLVPLNSHERSKNENLQLGIMEYKVYHDALLNSKSRNDFNRLHNLHTLDMIEEDDDCHCNVQKCLSITKKGEQVVNINVIV
jgi:ABC-type uncharacterized transport system involved in gliding motility auxiliary subunit